MRNVFLDSNIFIQENYLQGKYIKALLKLGQDGVVNIFIHDIVLGEVKSNFKKHLEISLKAYGVFRNTKKNGARYLRNVKIGQSIATYEKLKVDELHEEFCEKLESKLYEANVKNIPFFDINIQSIFKNYFERKPPFGLKEEKKHGFPDAFLIEFIKKWVVSNNEKLTILTEDNDYNHINNYKNLINTQKDHRVFVDEVNKAIIREEKLKEYRLQKVDKILENNIKNIKVETQKYIEDYLYDESIYWPLFNTDVYDLSNLQFGDILNLETYIVEIVNEEEIEVEISFKLKYSIDVLVDNENAAVYDSEDKVMLYFERVNIEVEGGCDINTSVVLSIIDEENYDESVHLYLNKDDVTIEVYSKDEIY